jgi:hypothetical protein
VGSRIKTQLRKDSLGVVTRQVRADLRGRIEDEDISTELAEGCYRAMPTCRE